MGRNHRGNEIRRRAKCQDKIAFHHTHTRSSHTHRHANPGQAHAHLLNIWTRNIIVIIGCANIVLIFYMHPYAGDKASVCGDADACECVCARRSCSPFPVKFDD